MQKDRKSRFFIILLLIVSIWSLSVAYASFSQVLSITGQVYFDGKSWSIKMIEVGNAKVIGNAKEISKPELTSYSITLDVEFENTDDEITYDFKVKNDGNIDAVLNSDPLITGTNEYLSVLLEYKDGEEIKEGDSLLAGESKDMVIKIKCLKPCEDEECKNFGISSTFMYVQK